jgi:hypothetical protein
LRFEIELLFAALFAVAAYFRARGGDGDPAIFFDLLFQLLVERRLELADRSAFQTGDVDVIAGAVAFIEMLVATQVQQIEFIDQAVAFQQIDGAVDGHAMDARVKLLRAVQNGAGIEMALGAVHHLEQNFSLTGQAHAAFGEGFLQAAGALMGVDSLAGGDSMGCGGHDSVRVTA